MKKEDDGKLNLTSKILLGTGAAFGVGAIFFPPLAIPAACLAAVGGGIEIADAIKTRKLAKDEANRKLEDEIRLLKGTKKKTVDLEKTVDLGHSAVINPNATKDNVKSLGNREKKQDTVSIELTSDV